MKHNLNKYVYYIVIAVILVGLLLAATSSHNHPQKTKKSATLIVRTDKKEYVAHAGDESVKVHITGTPGAVISMPDSTDSAEKIRNKNGVFFELLPDYSPTVYDVIAKYKGQTKYIKVKIIPTDAFISSAESEESAERSSSVASSSDGSQAESTTASSQSTTQSTTDQGSNNTVYGQLTRPASKLAGGAYKDKDMTYVTYGVEPDKTINVVKESFTDVPLDPELDSESIDEHVHDFMEKDAVKVSDVSDTESIYQSNSLGKKFQVEFQKNVKGEITIIIIRREDINE